MLFKYIEEINMPSLMHCIECDKPGILSSGLCNNCYERQKEDIEPTTADKYNKEWLDEDRTETTI
jgi:hypothetical protein